MAEDEARLADNAKEVVAGRAVADRVEHPNTSPQALPNEVSSGTSEPSKLPPHPATGPSHSSPCTLASASARSSPLTSTRHHRSSGLSVDEEQAERSGSVFRGGSAVGPGGFEAA